MVPQPIASYLILQHRSSTRFKAILTKPNARYLPHPQRKNTLWRPINQYCYDTILQNQTSEDFRSMNVEFGPDKDTFSLSPNLDCFDSTVNCCDLSLRHSGPLRRIPQRLWWKIETLKIFCNIPKRVSNRSCTQWKLILRVKEIKKANKMTLQWWNRVLAARSILPVHKWLVRTFPVTGMISSKCFN